MEDLSGIRAVYLNSIASSLVESSAQQQNNFRRPIDLPSYRIAAEFVADYLRENNMLNSLQTTYHETNQYIKQRHGSSWIFQKLQIDERKPIIHQLIGLTRPEYNPEVKAMTNESEHGSKVRIRRKKHRTNNDEEPNQSGDTFSTLEDAKNIKPEVKRRHRRSKTNMIENKDENHPQSEDINSIPSNIVDSIEFETGSSIHIEPRLDSDTVNDTWMELEEEPPKAIPLSKSPFSEQYAQFLYPTQFSNPGIIIESEPLTEQESTQIDSSIPNGPSDLDEISIKEADDIVDEVIEEAIQVHSQAEFEVIEEEEDVKEMNPAENEIIEEIEVIEEEEVVEEIIEVIEEEEVMED